MAKVMQLGGNEQELDPQLKHAVTNQSANTVVEQCLGRQQLLMFSSRPAMCSNALYTHFPFQLLIGPRQGQNELDPISQRSRLRLREGKQD